MKQEILPRIELLTGLTVSRLRVVTPDEYVKPIFFYLVKKLVLDHLLYII
jgi:hypothetical protein